MRQWQSKWILIAAFLAGVLSERHAGAVEGPVSLGYPNSGRLIGGRRFRETSFMVTMPSHTKSRARWALPALLSVLERASRIVARKFPGSVLEIGELSQRDGGRIASHLSHQNGRDADVGFYLVDMDGAVARTSRFIRCDASGQGREDPTLRFDEKRNWAFVRAVLEDPRFEVRQIFIYAPLRARLLAYAAQVGAPRELRAKAAAAMMQPVNALPHDDHFHIRISCPADQLEQGCADLPMWKAPGSPDEFGPELLARAPRPKLQEPEPAAELPLDGWARLSRIWSAERGVCDKQGLVCAPADDGPACEDLGDFGLRAPALPPDEMGREVAGTGESPLVAMSSALESTLATMPEQLATFAPSVRPTPGRLEPTPSASVQLAASEPVLVSSGAMVEPNPIALAVAMAGGDAPAATSVSADEQGVVTASYVVTPESFERDSDKSLAAEGDVAAIAEPQAAAGYCSAALEPIVPYCAMFYSDPSARLVVYRDTPHDSDELRTSRE